MQSTRTMPELLSIMALVLCLVLGAARGPGVVAAPRPGGDSISSQAQAPKETTWGGPTPAAPAVKKVPAVALRPVSGPDGDYTIALPTGWTVAAPQGAPQGSEAFIATPAGQQQPSLVMLPMLDVSDSGLNQTLLSCLQQVQRNPLGTNVLSDCVIPAVETQIAESSHPWTPLEALQLIQNLLASSGNVIFGTPSVKPVTSSSAQFAVALTAQGEQLEVWGYIHMLYLSNPMLQQPSGQPGVSSFAFLTYCDALPDQHQRFLPTCATAIRSFTPSQAWLDRLAQQAMQTYQQEVQILLQMGESVVANSQVVSNMIQRAGTAVQQMQEETYQQTQAVRQHIAEDWIATLSGQTNEKDPATGTIYLLPGGYASYCLTTGGDTLAADHPLTVGEGPANDQCVRLLHHW